VEQKNPAVYGILPNFCSAQPELFNHFVKEICMSGIKIFLVLLLLLLGLGSMHNLRETAKKIKLEAAQETLRGPMELGKWNRKLWSGTH